MTINYSFLILRPHGARPLAHLRAVAPAEHSNARAGAMVLGALLALSLTAATLLLSAYALLLLVDLRDDRLNPHAFVRRLEPKLRIEAALHLPLMLVWPFAPLGWLGAAGFILTLLSACARLHWWRRDGLALDVTGVFQPRTQRSLAARWTLMTCAHVVALLGACCWLVALAPADLDLYHGLDPHSGHFGWHGWHPASPGSLFHPTHHFGGRHHELHRAISAHESRETHAERHSRAEALWGHTIH